MSSSDIVQNLFVTGLRDAHAVENQALALMDRQLGRLENYPELEQRLREHRAETEGQIARLDEMLDRLGESASALKDAAFDVRQRCGAWPRLCA